MSRPLLITDCDEVLLHMVRHFGAWLDEEHAVDFTPVGGRFENAMRRQACGTILSNEDMWVLLDAFFATEMRRQTLVPGAREALALIAEVADIVILTNLAETSRDHRSAQLSALGIAHRVVCNGHGPKGAGVVRLIEEYRPGATVFVDDLAWHHEAVARAAPEVFRLHMIAEPPIAREVPPAPFADARIDDWAAAVKWILARFDGQAPRRSHTELEAFHEHR